MIMCLDVCTTVCVSGASSHPPSQKLQRFHPPHNEINILLRSCLQIFLIKQPFDSLAIWPEPKKVLIKEAQIRSGVTPSLGQGPWKVVIVDFTKVVSSDPFDKLKHILLFSQVFHYSGRGNDRSCFLRGEMRDRNWNMSSPV